TAVRSCPPRRRLIPGTAPLLPQSATDSSAVLLRQHLKIKLNSREKNQFTFVCFFRSSYMSSTKPTPRLLLLVLVWMFSKFNYQCTPSSGTLSWTAKFRDASVPKVRDGGRRRR
uniref:Uncharacterized protein n=2 Tax=Aegilops tauschii subsp. strangulata TaxID=200361 RepID=A0A453I2P6_AEGTS